VPIPASRRRQQREPAQPITATVKHQLRLKRQATTETGQRRRLQPCEHFLYALESYRAAGYERSVLTVDTGNATGALRLYERAGYAVKDTSVVWTKPLG
jgi:hypothetical protein